MNADMAFRFLDIRPELRNRVYKYALTVPCEQTERVEIKKHAQCSALSCSCTVLAILQICTQVHEEAQAIFYDENHLGISGKELPEFVTCLEKCRLQAIRRLTVLMDTGGFHTIDVHPARKLPYGSSHLAVDERD